MNQNLETYGQAKDQIKTSTLILLAFSTLFFARPLDLIGAPEVINFIHFALVPLVCGLALITTRTKDRQQITTTWLLIFSLLIFLGVMLISALLNQAGVVNVFIDFLLLIEPFILLLGVISLNISQANIKRLQGWLIIFALFNLLAAYSQRYVLGSTNPDNIYGVFFSVAGATVSSTVSVIFACYYLVDVKSSPIWMRVFVVAAAIWQVVIADTKLVMGSFVLGFIVLSFTKLNRRILGYLIALIVLCCVFWWCVQNLEIFVAYKILLKPEYFTPDSAFIRAKSTAFRVIPTYYESFANYLFGLGPGHTIGRLGGWMMDKYWHFLGPLGATQPFPGLGQEIMLDAAQQSREVLGTAMFGPLFSWAGIWGDLGIVGLGAYLLIWLIVWCNICVDDLSKLFVLSLFLLGFFPGYLEEPGSMLFTIFIIGLRWHQRKITSKNQIISTQIPIQSPLSRGS